MALPGKNKRPAPATKKPAAKAKVYDNTNRGALWNNESDHPQAPVLKGSLDVEGVKYWVAVWPVESESDKAPAYRLSIEAAE